MDAETPAEVHFMPDATTNRPGSSSIPMPAGARITELINITTASPVEFIGEFDPYHDYPLVPLKPFESESTQPPLKSLAKPDEFEKLMLGDESSSGATLRLGVARRFNFAAFIPAFVTSLLTAGAASALLGWLLSRRVVSSSTSAFVGAVVAAETRPSDPSGEGTGTTMYGLAFSSVAAHLVSFTAPFLLGVLAYLLASMWLQDQARGRIDSLPTPTQYGHLVGLCGSFGFSSLYDTAKYLSRRRTDRPAAPTTLVVAFFVALSALLLTYALIVSLLTRCLLDWAEVLDPASTTFSHEFSNPIVSTSLPAVGARINTALCPGPAPFLLNGTTYSNCQHSQPNPVGPDMIWGNSGLINEGSSVLSNSSLSSQIQFIGDFATLLPKRLPSSVQNLIFSTLAMEATCKPVSDCEEGANLNGTNETYFLICPSFVPPFAVRDASSAMPMINQFNVTGNVLIFQSGTPEAPAADVGPPSESRTAGYALNSVLNPAGVLVSLYWAMDPAELSPPSSLPGWYGVGVTPILYTFYIGTCVLDVWDIVLSYSAPTDGTSPSFTVVSPPTRSDFNTTSALLAALDSAYSATLASHLTTTLQPSLSVSSETFSSLLAGNVSQGVLAYAAPLTVRTNSTSGEAVTLGTVSRYPLAPLCTVLVLTYAYALFALGVGIAAFTCPSREIIAQDAHDRSVRQRIREIDLVHLRLTSARACIADRFDGENTSESMLAGLKDTIFTEGRQMYRLGAGFVQSEATVFDDGASLQVVRRNVRRYKVDIVDNLEEEFKKGI
ncbi:hypothetical protein DFH09DRAFT_1284360 [Mycena vulgaris]|nr:hypothetical protein DFH09DRAFT_1284360 [Mycena vulgaris]